MTKRSRKRLWSIAAIALLGCERASQPLERAQESTTPPAVSAPREAIDPSATGTLIGEIVFEGEPPAREPLATAGVGGCGGDGVLSERVIVTEGKLANVLARIDVGDRWIVPEASAREQAMTQRRCVFEPHVVALRAGDSLLVANDDPTTHNVRVKSRRRGNAEGSHTQAAGAPPLRLTFQAPETGIEIVCDLHPWMRAWVHVLDHPFRAVTGEDGRFEIPGVPAGEHALETWHETLGKRSVRVRVEPNATSKARIVYSAGG